MSARRLHGAGCQKEAIRISRKTAPRLRCVGVHSPLKTINPTAPVHADCVHSPSLASAVCSEPSWLFEWLVWHQPPPPMGAPKWGEGDDTLIALSRRFLRAIANQVEAAGINATLRILYSIIMKNHNISGAQNVMHAQSDTTPEVDARKPAPTLLRCVILPVRWLMR